VLVVNRFVKEGDKKILMPNIAANIMNTAEGFYFFFKVYSRKSYDSAEIGIRILNAKKSEVYRKVIHEALKDTIVPILIKVEEPKLAVGPYEASFWAKPLSSKDSLVTIATSSRAFAVRWTDVPVMIRDIDKAVEQLIYIARGGELDFIREAPTAEEKKKRFLEFWAKRDPDQNTERNELMEEYYRRVEYCNNAFASYIEGWRTDRGMVYIRFGAPENVERHPFEYNTKPYEVWYYYQQNRQFVFVDESGFGDYRLRYPTTDLWGRIR
jgi:GWxTD domain-containing protein